MKNLGYLIVGIGAALNASQSESLIMAISATCLIVVGIWMVAYITFDEED